MQQVRSNIRSDPLARWVSLYRWSAAAILCIAGAAKLYSASAGGADVFLRPDPLLGISFRALLAIVGAGEIACAAVALGARSQFVQVTVVTILSMNILLYRIGLMIIGYKGPCDCLGSLTQVLSISPHVADIAMKVVLGYLVTCGVVLSFATLFAERRMAVSVR